MTDNKQYPPGGAPYPTQDITTGYTAFPPTAGIANPGYGVPPTGFAGYGLPAQGQGMGLMGPPPPMGFHLPPQQGYSDHADDGPKYSGESGSSSYGDINGFDFSEKTIRRAFIRYTRVSTFSHQIYEITHY